MNSAPANLPPPENTAPAQDVDWRDFRDHLATADKEGRRRWIYPAQPQGRFYRWRTWLSWLLLTILFAGPFVRIHGNPLLMMNVIQRRFSILGQIFWPQDTVIFAVAMLLFLTAILVFTAAFGRLWCGWTCPQTLLMEMVFRKIEYLIEGGPHAQHQLDAAPLSLHKFFKKSTKHTLFFGLSFIIGNTLLSYVIGTDDLARIVTDNPRHHLAGLTFMVLFTAVFYAIFARFREQACTFICPYGRLQSTVIDENTLAVAYDHVRGENRGRWQRAVAPAQRRTQGLGDCVDCFRCVTVCPTGIDIRNGTQMECVSCTACIDACDSVMAKLGRPPGLIRYASLNSIERGEHFKITPRLLGYTAILLVLGAALGLLIFLRSDIEITFLRAPGGLFQETADGNISNLYTVKLVNKTSHDVPVELKLEHSPGTLSVMGSAQLIVPSEQLIQTPVLIELNPESLHHGRARLQIGVFSQHQRLTTVNTVFIGPRHSEHSH